MENNMDDFISTVKTILNSSNFSNLSPNDSSISSSEINTSNNQSNFSTNAQTNPKFNIISSEQSTDKSDKSFKNQSDEHSNTFSSSFDIETILKIKNIMSSLNKKDDPRTNLLFSLKPYLRKNRQDKIDQYVNLLKIAKITDFIKNEKGE